MNSQVAFSVEKDGSKKPKKQKVSDKSHLSHDARVTDGEFAKLREGHVDMVDKLKEHDNDLAERDRHVARFHDMVMAVFGDKSSKYFTGKFQADKPLFVKGKSWESVGDSDLTPLQRRVLLMLRDIVVGPKGKAPFCRVEEAEGVFKKWRDESEIAKHLAGNKKSNKSKVAASASISETLQLLTLKP